MLEKGGLIEFILEHGEDFCEKELQILPLITLVIIKVQIELNLQMMKNCEEGVQL